MPLPELEAAELLRLARASILSGLAHGRPFEPDLSLMPARLREAGASFVTLTLHGRLRGCIGSLTARRPLAEDVARNAYESAFGDPRFPPLAADEEPGLHIEISLLGTPEPLPCASLEDLLGRLRPGQDGLIIEDGGCRATFLPSVWEQLPSPRDFVDHLMQKAGLPRKHWSPSLRTFRYTAEKIRER